MTTNESFPKFDLPVDFIADDSITGDILNCYCNFPLQNKSRCLCALYGRDGQSYH